jgi:CubicO group peptidase (beta-lactamase class C family)
MMNHRHCARRFVASIVVLGLCSVALRAEEAKRSANVADAADLEAFFDGAITVQRESKHIAGAVVAVVVGDKVVFTKGYGYADVAARRPVDPDKTPFRIGSITKLFTWTAVMQQVEEGKLNLDADVNGYLKDVKIPSSFEQPVTLKNLLTHTPGFDDVVLGLFARKPEDIPPLAQVLREQMPTRVRPPGVLASYSNHGTAIAGYAVACVSGKSWEDYVEQRILKPLGMEHTLVRQPAEADLPADMSKGYKWEAGEFKAKDFEYVPIAPAGCMSMTGADAAKFMLAHLHDGRLGDRTILRPETARRMREPLFRHNPKTSAMCYGFIESQRFGQRLVGHGGDTLWFHSLLTMIPDQHVGLFVSYNTDTGGGVRDDLLDAFLRRYFPDTDPPRTKSGEGFRERANRLAGEYVLTRYSHTSIAKLVALLGVYNVSVNDDDTLTIGSLGGSSRYVEIEPYVFRELDGRQKVVFQEDENGGVRTMFLADVPIIAAERRTWHERSMLHLGVAGGSLALLLTALLYWPVIAFSVRGLSSPEIKRTGFSALLSILAWLLSAVCIGLTLGTLVAMRDPNQIVFGLTPLLKALLSLTPACAILAALAVLGSLIAWIKGYWRLTGRIHYTLVALAGIGFTWFLYYWNLLSLGFVGIES